MCLGRQKIKFPIKERLNYSEVGDKQGNMQKLHRRQIHT